MTLKDFEYFIALAELQHFRLASEKVGISQPAFSIQIKKLEHELGLQLFERDKKSVVLSPEAKELLPRAKNILQDAKDFRAFSQSLKNPYQGKFTLGAFPTLAPYLFPKIFDDLHSSYPELKLYIIEEKTSELLKQVKSGQLDAAFIALPHEDSQLEHRNIFGEDFLFAVGPQSSWAKKKQITKEELVQEKLLLLSEGHCLRKQSLEICGDVPISEDYDFRASSLETLRQMVRSDIGSTLIPECARQTGDGIHYLKISGSQARRQIALFWRKSSAKAVICEEIADEVRNIMLD